MITGTERRRQGCSLQDGKQWGKILGDTVNLKIINFPVSFNECFGGLALFNGDPVAAAEYATITDITNTNFKIYMYANNAGTGYANANIFYLFLGAQQQWGINSAGNNGSEGESGWYAFPVNFNSACFALFCGLRNTDTNNPTKYDSEVQPRNWTTSKFNVYKQDYGGDPWFGSFIWFAIGRQPASYKL